MKWLRQLSGFNREQNVYTASDLSLIFDRRDVIGKTHHTREQVNKKRRQKSRNSPSLFWERRFDAIVFASSIAHARLSHENHSRHHHRRPSHFTLLCTTRRRDEDPRGPTTTTTVTTVAGIVLSSCGLPLPAERRNGCRVEDEEPPFQYSHHGSNLRTPQGD